METVLQESKTMLQRGVVLKIVVANRLLPASPLLDGFFLFFFFLLYTKTILSCRNLREFDVARSDKLEVSQ